MADKKISQLTAASTPLAGTEVLPIVQSGSTVKVSIADVTAGRSVATGALTSTIGDNGAFSLKQNGANQTGFINFVDSDNANAGRVKYDHFNNSLQLFSNTVEHLRIESTGNIRAQVGNIILGTAAKGIDFSANTGAAGETSALLNWYEEGTWTPAITSNGGSITSTSLASGNYTRVGNQVTIWFTITITDNGTGSGYIKLTGMPFNLTSVGKTVGSGVEAGVSSKQLVIYGNSASELIVTFYDGTYPGATNAVLNGCVTYYV